MMSLRLKYIDTLSNGLRKYTGYWDETNGLFFCFKCAVRRVHERRGIYIAKS